MDSTVEDQIIRSVIGKTNLTDSEINVIIQIFKYYDSDNDSHLTKDEATLMLAELGYKSGVWTSKRIPLETFLLECGHQKRENLEDKEELEAKAHHTFRILDIPSTGTVNQHKLKHFLEEVDFSGEGIEVDAGMVERLSELISSGDGTDFTQDDLFCYIANNQKLAEAFANVQDGEAGVNKVTSGGGREGVEEM